MFMFMLYRKNNDQFRDKSGKVTKIINTKYRCISSDEEYIETVTTPYFAVIAENVITNITRAETEITKNRGKDCRPKICYENKEPNIERIYKNKYNYEIKKYLESLNF